MDKVATIDPWISDLFFNLDFEDAKLADKDGQFVGWDRTIMRDRARWFYAALEHLMFRTPPSPDAILADFYARV